MTKRNLWIALFAAALLVPLGGMDGCGEGGATCDGEADCGVDEHCHPFLKVCQANCMKVDTACDSLPGTTCSEEDIIDPIDGMSFNGLCVCDPDDDKCESDEGCNPKDLQCEAPCTDDSECEDADYPQDRVCRARGDGDKFCDTGADACPETPCTSPQVCNAASGECMDPCTDDATCGTDMYCDDGRFSNSMLCLAWPPSCSDHDGCVSAGYLCNGTECADPDEVTAAACSSTPAVSRSASDNSPLVLDVDTSSCLDAPVCGDASKVRMLLLIEVYDPDGDFSTTPVSDIHGYSYSTSANITPQQPGSDWTGTGDTRFVSFPVCLDPSTTRDFYFWVDDAAGNSSNAFCTSVVVPADSSGC